MKINRNQVLNYINDCENINDIVAILELAAHKSEVNTISERARLDGKSPNGVRESKQYRKTLIGVQLMTFPKGLKDTNFPF
jgi:hypothetical protein